MSDLGAGALSGLTVLDLSRLLPGPYCSMILGDHGARVIVIEDRRFLEDDLLIETVNRNKEHMSLNLKTEEGKEFFLRLAGKADIIIEGFRPGVVKRLGIDYETLKEINPRIIYCSITGYGQTGQYSDRTGHDINYLSISGILSLMGKPESIPEVPRVQLGDIAGGGMNAVIGILMALYAREKTGRGQYIDISMSDGLIGFLSIPLNHKLRKAKNDEPLHFLAPERLPCYNVYETSDGQYITIGAVEKRFWENLCLYLDVPQYVDLQYSEEHSDEISAFMEKRFREKTVSQWEKALSSLDVCYAKVQTMEEALRDPFFKERGMIIEMEGENGEKTISLGVPVKLSETPGSIRSFPRQFGEDTISILRENGYSERDIREMSERNVF